jgi:hypothetical protein
MPRRDGTRIETADDTFIIPVGIGTGLLDPQHVRAGHATPLR